MKWYWLGGVVWLCIAFGVHAQGVDDTLAKIKASCKIVTGTRDASAPLAYASGRVGNHVGYHVDICNRVVDAIKAEFKMPSHVVNVRMLVRADSPITSIAQLDGKNVVTTTGTTSVQHLRKHERAANLKYNVVSGKDHSESFSMLESGRADAFVMDDNILAGLKTNAVDPAGFKIVGETLSEEPCAIVYRKDDPALKRVVENAVTSAALKNAIAYPNDKPAENYASK